jgi:serine protease Do
MPSTLSKKFAWPLVAAIAIAGGSFLGTVELSRTPAANAQSAQVLPVQAETAKPTPEPRTDAVAPASDLSRAFRTVHNALKDAVVNINVSKKASGLAAGNSRLRMQVPPQFRNMIPPDMDPDGAPDDAPEAQGTGSGVIVSADGYIVTNNHVVRDASDIKVTLNDGRELKADLVGTDPKTDLAVIRVKAESLTYAKFGDSDVLDVGDWVLAFGSPFGFSQTMTQGIISAKGRHVPIIAMHDPTLRGMTYENFLQTDAAINPGNSGGPLVNLKGEVVGINAAIASNTGAYNGIGFSIPSNDVKYIMDSLIKNGKVVRGYLGVKIEDLSQPAPEDRKLADSIRKSGFTGNGVLVNSVEGSGPAGQAGLQPGDVITQIDGRTFKSVDELRNFIARARPDSKLNMTVYRDGKTQNLTVTVGTQPESLQVASAGGRANDNAADSKDLGISVQDLTPARAQRYGLRGNNRSGVVISSVAPGSLAAEMGLNPGDVILRVDRTPVSSTKEFQDAIANAKLADGVKLTVRGDDGMDRLVYIEKK